MKDVQNHESEFDKEMKENEAKIDALSKKKAERVEEVADESCLDRIRAFFKGAKSASIRRKLGGMAPTMGKLLKALKRMSQRMKKGERAA